MYEIKSRTEYRSRTITNTYHWYKDTGYSGQASSCSGNCIGSTTYNWTQRSYTTSGSSSMSGWTHYNTTSYVSYGSWGSYTGYNYSYNPCSDSNTCQAVSSSCCSEYLYYTWRYHRNGYNTNISPENTLSNATYEYCWAPSVTYYGNSSISGYTYNSISSCKYGTYCSHSSKASNYWCLHSGDGQSCYSTYTCYAYRTRSATTIYTYYFYKDTTYSNQSSTCSSNCVGNTTYNYTLRSDTTTVNNSTAPSGYTACTGSTTYCVYPTNPVITYGEWSDWTEDVLTSSYTQDVDNRTTCVYREKLYVIE